MRFWYFAFGTNNDTNICIRNFLFKPYTDIEIQTLTTYLGFSVTTNIGFLPLALTAILILVLAILYSNLTDTESEILATYLGFLVTTNIAILPLD